MTKTRSVNGAIWNKILPQPIRPPPGHRRAYHMSIVIMGKRIAGIGLGVLIVNSGYIAALAEPTIFYMGNVLLHLGLGLALMVFAAVWARRYPWVSAAFLLSGLPAIYLAVGGNTMDHRWVLWLHIVLAVFAVGIAGLRLFHSRVSHAWRMAFVYAAAALIVLPAARVFYHHARPHPNDLIQKPLVAPAPMDQEAARAHPPFAPSAAQTNTAPISPSN